MIKEAISKLLERQDLNQTEAEGVMQEIMHGEATPSQIGGFLIALRMKGETPEEIAGCARAMVRETWRFVAAACSFEKIIFCIKEDTGVHAFEDELKELGTGGR